MHENIKSFIHGFRYDAHPMGMLMASVGALSTFYPEAHAVKDPDVRYAQVIRLIAKMPTLAAFAYRHSRGMPYVYPDNDLSYAGNFLSMLYKMSEPKYEPNPLLEHALDVLFILHADHEQNCSASAVRSVGSSQVDPYSAVAAGVAALYGPLHGGANEAVLRMLHRIERKENIPDFIDGVKQGNERLMGFGHRVYKNYDPRARIIKTATTRCSRSRAATRCSTSPSSSRRSRSRTSTSSAASSIPTSTSTRGSSTRRWGCPFEMFPVLFAIARTSGWIAQWLEMVEDPEQKISRPRQVYIGEHELDYVPIARRA